MWNFLFNRRRLPDVAQPETCEICLSCSETKKLATCPHWLCDACMKKIAKREAKCPFCRVPFPEVQNQPISTWSSREIFLTYDIIGASFDAFEKYYEKGMRYYCLPWHWDKYAHYKRKQQWLVAWHQHNCNVYGIAWEATRFGSQKLNFL